MKTSRPPQSAKPDLPVCSEVCPVCAHQDRWDVVLDVQETETAEWYSIQRCRQCGVLRTWPAPENLSPFYEGELGRLMRQKGGWLYEALKTFSLTMEFRRFIPGDRDVTVLDVGCGSGDFSKFIHDKGFRVVAADSSPEKPVRIRDLPAVSYHPMSFDTYEIQGLNRLTNGLVVVRHVVEHLRDPALFLRRMIGYGVRFFYVAVPDVACIARSLFGPYWFAWDPPRHLWHFDRHSMSALLEGAGIKPVKWGHIPSNMVPASVYRYFKLKNVSDRICQSFGPKTSISGLLGGIDAVFADSVLCVFGRLESEPDSPGRGTLRQTTAPAPT